MRYFIAASACAAALLGFAPASLAQTTGHVGVQFMRADEKVPATGDYDVDFYTLEGALRTGSAVIGGSVDGRLTYSDDGGYNQTAFAGTAHVNTRFGGDFALLGAFGGVDRSEDAKIWGAGLEAQANVAQNLILYAQGGYGETRSLYPLLAQVWATRGDVRLFPTDNIKLQASASYQWISVGPLKTHSWMAGVEGEYQIPNTNLSLIAAYDRYRIGVVGNTADIGRIGARYTFGAGSLRQRERTGEDLGTVQRLFNLEQWR
jgi:hypothetical protein